jgi:predicted Zn-dependent peptidase
MEDLARATLDDVRQFFRTYYTPANLTLAIAGSFAPEHALSEVERTFGQIGGLPAPPLPEIDDSFRLQGRRLLMKDSVKLPRLYISWKGPRVNTQDEVVFDLLTNYLTSGRTSLLHRSLVYQAQIAQGVDGYVDGMEGTGIIQIVATAQTGEGLGKIEELLLKELEGVAKRGITESEFEGARNRAEMELMQVRVSALQKAGALSTYQTLTHSAENANRILDRFAGIVRSELREAASSLLNSERITLSVVPEGEPELSAPGSEEVR